MKVLIVGGIPTGGGAREHVLADMASKSPEVSELYCFAPQNTGIMAQRKMANMSQFAVPENNAELAEFAAAQGIDLTIVGPEAPLAAGIVDEFMRRELPIFGPTAAAAELESSKWFAKQVMEVVNVSTASARMFTDFNLAADHIRQRQHSVPLVVKCDGLAQGKGVRVCRSRAEAIGAAEDFLVKRTMKAAGETILVEDYLVGSPSVSRPELSVFAFVDRFGHILMFQAAQDYKRALDGDEGENTGGMGSISPVPWVTDQMMVDIEKSIFRPVIDLMKETGRPYTGVLYAGLMLTLEGFKVVEFNVRFGDPEIVALYPLIKTDLIPIMKTIALGGSIASFNIEWSEKKSVCVVVADVDYPAGKKPRSVPSDLVVNGLQLHAFDAAIWGHHGGYISTGGRVADLVGIGTEFEDARAIVYNRLARIPLANHGLRCRSDIGLQCLSNEI